MRITFKIQHLKYFISSTFIFLISPILAWLFILYGLLRKYKYTLFLISLGAGLIAFQLSPNATSDMARHYELYEDMRLMEFNGLKELIKEKPDFLFYFLMFCFAKTGLSPQWFALFGAFISVRNYFSVFHSFFKDYPSKIYFLGAIIFIMTFQWSHLFLGLRNYLAFSFVFLAISNLLHHKKGNNLLLLIIASFIHFSSIAFILIFFLIKLSKKNIKIGLILYFTSFLFLFLTKDILLGFVEIIPLPENISLKVSGYLSNEDIIQESISKDIAARISFALQFSWFYFGNIYLLLTTKKKSVIRSINYILYFMLNIFFVAPDPFNRFSYIVRPFLFFLIIHDFYLYRYKLTFLAFSSFMILYALIDFYTHKNVYIWSIFDPGSLTMVGILLKEYFIYP